MCPLMSRNLQMLPGGAIGSSRLPKFNFFLRLFEEADKTENEKKAAAFVLPLLRCCSFLAFLQNFTYFCCIARSLDLEAMQLLCEE